MITYGFFNSVNGDRTYNADQMSEYFDGLISSGVFMYVGGGLKVEADEEEPSMTVSVSTGRAIINCKWLNNDAVLPITISPSHPTMSRYTSVIVRLNSNNRTMEITTKDGEPSNETPTKPELSRGAISEYSLADIYVGADATELYESDIEDVRYSPERCGWVTGIVNRNASLLHYRKDTQLDIARTVALQFYPAVYSYSPQDIIDVYINGLKGIIWTETANYWDFKVRTDAQTPYLQFNPNLQVGADITIDITKAN